MYKRILLLAIVFISFFEVSYSAYLKDYPVVVYQPDGTQINCFATGDEYYNFLHDIDGYVIIQNQNGFYYFAEKSGIDLIPSKYGVLHNNPNLLNLQKWVTPDKSIIDEKINEFMKDKELSEYKSNPSLQSLKKGKLNNVVIFISFADQVEFSDSIAKYERMYNTKEGISFRNFYLKASFDQLDVTTHFLPPSNSTIISIKNSKPRGYYSPYNEQTNPTGYTSKEEHRRERDLLDSTIAAVAASFPKDIDFDSDNDGKIDNVTFIVRGGANGWSSLLWPHRSWFSGKSKINGLEVYDYNMMMSDLVDSQGYGLGTLCHEYFHSLGSPDLYHYSQDGTYATGRWDLMEATANPPQFMCGYLKYQYTGWVSDVPEITEEGEYTLNPITSPTNNIYKIKSPNSTSEFFTVEYRKKEGNYDISLPGSGLLLYRINSKYNKKGNAAGPPDEIYLYRPNANIDNEGSIGDAHLSADVNRTSISDLTNPRIFLSDGSYGGIEIYDITKCEETIKFKLGYTIRTVFTNPQNNSFDQPIKPTLIWRKYSAANVYQLQFAKDSNFTNIIYEQASTIDSSFAVSNNLDFSSRYFARVRWKNDNKISGWSETLVFTTIPSKPKLLYPTDKLDTVSILPTFVWNKINNATSYRIIISEKSDFSSTYIKKIQILDTFFLATKVLKLNTTFYWKIQCTTSSNYVTESDVFSFITKVKDLVIQSSSNSKSICKNDSVAIKISPSGSFDKFQWYQNGKILPNSNDSIYIIKTMNEANEGDYTCIVSSTELNYAVSSHAINLSIIRLPKILEEGKLISTKIGQRAFIKIVIDQTMPYIYDIYRFQWFRNGVALSDSGNYRGTNGLELTIFAATESDSDSTYSLRIATICGDTLFSINTSLFVSVRNEIDYDYQLLVSPNPVGDNLNLRILSNQIEKASISLFDVNGTMVNNLWQGYLSYGLNDYNFDMKKLYINSGVYMIVLKTDSKVTSCTISFVK